MDPVTGKMYDLKTNPPEDETIAARMIQRSVDNEDKITDQLYHYKSNNEAVCQVFVEQLKRVDGERNEEELGVAIDQIITEIQNV
jgi:adenylate kinase